MKIVHRTPTLRQMWDFYLRHGKDTKKSSAILSMMNLFYPNLKKTDKTQHFRMFNFAENQYLVFCKLVGRLHESE